MGKDVPRWASYTKSLLQDVPHVPQDAPLQASDGRFCEHVDLPIRGRQKICLTPQKGICPNN